MEDCPVTRAFPSIQELLTTHPLYAKEDISNLPAKSVWEIEYFQGSIDAYCVECKKPSVFRSEMLPRGDYIGRRFPSALSSQPEYIDKQDAQSDRTFTIELSCTRMADHCIWFFFRVSGGSLIKVGQYPSLADLAASEIEKYRKILGSNDYRELHRAIGLAAHGVGIGAFVYLRRIFEHLIEEAHQEAKKSDSWNESAYSNSRMDEKILLLNNLLPSFLVEHKILYSILSKGMHELSEDECLQAFSVVKLGIELILDEKIDKQEKERKIKDASKAIQLLHSSVKQSENSA
jgi:hypothetical protein